MKTCTRVGLLVSALGSTSTVISAELPVDVSTKGGIVISSKDKAYSVKLDGRIQADFNHYDGVMNADQGGESGSDFFFRRARLGVSGVVAKDWAYKAEFNINEGDGGDVTDLYIRYKGWGSKAQLTVGNQREHFGFENMTSSKSITAIERSSASNAWDAGRNVGVALNGYSDSWTYAAGIYEAGQDEDQIDFSYTARATFLPYKSESTTIHLGGGVRIVEGEVGNVRARPGIRQVDGSDRISAGLDDAEDLNAVNLEFAALWNNWHLSAEYFDASVDRPGNPGHDLNGYYVMAGWLLTGESRGYSTKKGAFDKVKPSGSGGAWEIFLRLSELNLQDQGLGNDASVSTLGLNWYANSQVRAGVNLVSTDYDVPVNGEDDGFGIAARLQLTF